MLKSPSTPPRVMFGTNTSDIKLKAISELNYLFCVTSNNSGMR